MRNLFISLFWTLFFLQIILGFFGLYEIAFVCVIILMALSLVYFKILRRERKGDVI